MDRRISIRVRPKTRQKWRELTDKYRFGERGMMNFLDFLLKYADEHPSLFEQ